MEVRLLGTLEVRVDDMPVEVGSRMQRGLLALLALQPGVRVGLEAVIDGLWQQPPDSARATVQGYVYALRRLLEPGRGPRAPAALLVSADGGYALRVPASKVDASSARRLASDGSAALRAGDLAAADQALRAALALWRGEPLAGLDQPFTVPARASLHDLRLNLEEQLADVELRLGRHAEVAARLGPLVASSPLREPLRERLVLALYRCGRQADALAVLDEGRRVLTEELGVEPGARLVELRAAVLRHEETLDFRPAPPVPLLSAQSSGAPFVGRSDELAMLVHAVSEARVQRGQVVLVLGEAGIGKSRLLTELCRHAAAGGALVLSGRAIEGGGAYRPVAEALVGFLRSNPAMDVDALGPYRAALARLLPDWTQPGTTGPEPGADPGVVLGEAVARLLSQIGRTGGCVLVLEDLHWADADTLALVVHLAGAVRSLPVLVAVSARDDAATGRIALLARTPSTATIRLGRLSDAAVAALVTGLRGRPLDEPALGQLTERAEGLPFLAEELVIGVDAPSTTGVPATFARLVADRLALLSAPQRRVLHTAAVVGSAPDWTLLAAVSGHSEDEVLDALRAATDAHLLTTDAAALRWRHALTRETVLAALLPPERAALARRAAQVLLARARPDDDAAAAELLVDAGAAAEAADLMLDLARRDLTRGALRTAEELLGRVEGTGLRSDAVDAERVRLFTLTGRAVEALVFGVPALDRATGDEHAELALRLARAAVAAARWAEAAGFVERAGRPDDPRTATLLADVAHGLGRIDEATQHAAAAIERAEAAGSAGELCAALLIAAKLDRLRDTAAAAAGFRRAAQVAAEHGLPAWRVEALIGLGTVELLESGTSASLPMARDLAAQAGLVGQVVAADILQLDTLLLSDGPAAAREYALRLQAEGSRLHLPFAEALGGYVFALVPAAAGRHTETERALNNLAFPPEAGPEAESLAPSVRAVEAVVTHDLQRATRLMDDAIAPLLRHASAAPLFQFGLWALLQTVAGERGADARAAVRNSPAGLRLANRAALQYSDAVVAGEEGRAADAMQFLATAEQTLAPNPWLRRLLRLITIERAVEDGWGDPVPLLRTSLAEHEAAGEDLLARTCRDLLRRAGAPTRRGRGDSAVPSDLAAAGVTSREMDVLVLIGEGATNTQIAQRLFLSRRTVETHVANLLLKTGAGDRETLRRRIGR